MSRIAEIRNQEMMYRERALLDTDRREFWLTKADEWAQRAVDEIALQFRESNGMTPDAAISKPWTSSQFQASLTASSISPCRESTYLWPPVLKLKSEFMKLCE
jgi:hypothetical protein